MARKIGLLAVACALAAVINFGLFAKTFGRPDPPRDLITKAIDEGQRIILRGNTRPEVRPENDRGPVPDEFPLDHMLLQLRRPPELQREFDNYVDGLTRGSSPNFHQWLTPDRLGQDYGLSESDLRKIEHWLRRHGFRVDFVYPNRVVMVISARAREMREAFHTDIHFLEVRGEKHYANVNDPEIPEALAPAVVGIVAIHDFRPHPAVRPWVKPAFSDASGYYELAPADLAAIYNINPLFSQGITGAGQTVALVEPTDPYTTNDWYTFRSTFQLDKYGGTLNVTHPNIGGNCTDPGVTSADFELALDMEWSLAAAPGAAINVAACQDIFTAFENLISETPPPYIISVSYAECEVALTSGGNSFVASNYQNAVSEGISIFVAAGDWGAAVCDAPDKDQTTATFGINVNGLASTVSNVAVGGTDFSDTYNAALATYWNPSNSPAGQSAKGYIPEIPWNNSCASVLIGMKPPGFPPGDAQDPPAFCPTAAGSSFYTFSAGSGGPSGCQTGVPAAATPNSVSGSCAGYAKPMWQSGLFGNPNDMVRDLPDVSLFAANGVWNHFYILCDSDPATGNSCSNPPSPVTGSWSGAGGTSFGAPILAGIQALVNQRTNALNIVGSPGQGNPNPVYYGIAKLEYPGGANANCDSTKQPVAHRGVSSSCVFYDVTQGDMSVNCTLGTPNCFDTDMTAGNKNGVLVTGGIAALTVPPGGGGTGYTSAPRCMISPPHVSVSYNGSSVGQQAKCTTTISGVAVNKINVTVAGSGYAPNPICTLTGGGGSGAQCQVSGITSTTYQPAFPTTPGWDFATGIGTINVYNLVFSTMWTEGP